MPDGGKLVISTDTVVAPAAMQTATGEIRPGRYVRVSVRDSGTGMLPEVQARIFEPFFTTKKAGKGTGLGLATVYGIVRQAGGAVTVDTLPGSGATFRILLPAEADACSKQDIAVPREAPLGTETLLLVEDEDSVRQITRTILEMQGYFVFDAGSAAEALELESNYLGRIDAVVTDLVMPEMGGRELAEMLQRRRPGIHVLFMSGHSSDAVVRKMVESSASHFLQKPFTPGALAQSVRDALDEKIPASL